jgi:TrmH family RNA methyltransferase
VPDDTFIFDSRQITMLSKAQIKYIQSLHQKKFRSGTGNYIAEGPKVAEEILVNFPHLIESISALPSWLDAHPTALQNLDQVKIHAINETELERISTLSSPNEVVVVLRKAEAQPWILPEGTWCLALDGIQDPGNLGTIIRIADWFGVNRMLCSQECAEWYNPKVIQASMGSFLRVQPCYTDLQPWLSSRKDPIYAATLEGEPITRLEKAAPGIVLIGNESKGIQPGLKALATKEVTIPRIGEAESLNAAVATGILLSHFCG